MAAAVDVIAAVVIAATIHARVRSSDGVPAVGCGVPSVGRERTLSF